MRALQLKNKFSLAKVNLSTVAGPKPVNKLLYATLGIGIGTGTVLLVALESSVSANEPQLHPYNLPWSHAGLFDAIDHASVRRGYEVYKQVCAACHSMRFMAYRKLVGVCFTEAEAKREAEEVQVTDGPTEEGEMFQRPGKLSDRFPNPYANEEAARHANNGAFPPDLSLITLARHGGESYVFHLLTGYMDTPAGVVLRDGQYYNPYFPGGAISMAQSLYNETIEYSDGTPATASQLAKDVSTFLKWAAEPEHDTRKEMALKAIMIFSLLIGVTWYWKRHVWSTIKTRKIEYRPRGQPKP
jgi:ubiquinol-cytochrome c reductase cytochrome c1 subunit